jgi:hypothetical protein
MFLLLVTARWSDILGPVGSVRALVSRPRAPLEARDRTIQALWIERAIILYPVAAMFATYAGLTMCYLFLGTLSAAANVLGAHASEPGAPPVRRALRAR